MLPKRTIPGQQRLRFADGLHRPIGLIFASGHVLFTACQLSGQLGEDAWICRLVKMLKCLQRQTYSLQLYSLIWSCAGRCGLKMANRLYSILHPAAEAAVPT